MALEQGKEVYALPGRVGDNLSEGCNRLIQQGAGIAVSPQDMVRALFENMYLTNKINIKAKESKSNKTKKNESGKYNSKTNVIQSGMESGIESGTKSVEKFDVKSNTSYSLQSKIINVLDDSPKSIEMIKEQMLFKYKYNISIPELMTQLMKLSLCGLVNQVSNSYFTRR